MYPTKDADVRTLWPISPEFDALEGRSPGRRSCNIPAGIKRCQMFKAKFSMNALLGRMRARRRVWAAFLWAFILATPSMLQAAPPLNVLFLIIDDLRPELPSYGRTQVHAPNIERLAQQGLVFHNAYANVPVCGASRGSLLTSVRPTRTRFVGHQARMDEDAPCSASVVWSPQGRRVRIAELRKNSSCERRLRRILESRSVESLDGGESASAHGVP